MKDAFEQQGFPHEYDAPDYEPDNSDFQKILFAEEFEDMFVGKFITTYSKILDDYEFNHPELLNSDVTYTINGWLYFEDKSITIQQVILMLYTAAKDIVTYKNNKNWIEDILVTQNDANSNETGNVFDFSVDTKCRWLNAAEYIEQQ